MNLHQSKFILSKDRMKFLAENLLPAWLCGRKWGFLTSTAKQMSVEPPVHTCSVNSFFWENLYLSASDMYKWGHSPWRGWSQAWGERRSSDSFPLWEPVPGQCSHLPADTSDPRFHPALREWPQVITREHSNAPSAHHCSALASPHWKVDIATF